MKDTQISFAYFSTSVIFFFYYGILSSVFWPSIGNPSLKTSILIGIPTVFSLISFVGSLGLILILKKHIPRWYWGVPLCLTIAVLLIAFTLSGLGMVTWFGYGYPLLLLAPCTALLFYSYRSDTNKNIMSFVWISLGVSVISGIALIQEIFRMLTPSGEPTVVGSEPIFYLLYILIGLPLIGVLFLLLAIRYRDMFNSRMEN